jgi:hypothetical protein
MLFGKLKKAIRKLFGLELTTTEISDVEESLKEIQQGQAKKFTNTNELLEELKTVEPSLPPSCHVIRYPERIRKPGSQAIHKVSPKNFKPRPAHERKLLNPKAKLEEEEN